MASYEPWKSVHARDPDRGTRNPIEQTRFAGRSDADVGTARGDCMKVKDLFWFLVLGGGALFAYDKYKSHQVEAEPEAAAVASTRAVAVPVEDRSWIKQRDRAPATGLPTSSFPQPPTAFGVGLPVADRIRR